jgi:hypothetical protein
MAERLHLTKHHGLRNDFLVALEADNPGLVLTSELAVRLCDRTAGIGADGLIGPPVSSLIRLSARWCCSTPMDHVQKSQGTGFAALAKRCSEMLAVVKVQSRLSLVGECVTSPLRQLSLLRLTSCRWRWRESCPVRRSPRRLRPFQPCAVVLATLVTLTWCFRSCRWMELTLQ